MKKPAPNGHTAKHSQAKKHAAAAKHHPKHPVAHPTAAHHVQVHTKAKHPVHATARGLPLAGDAACCAAEAVAASLRLTGWPVDDADVLALYEHTADDPDTGASILATLQAAAICGLAGARPASFCPSRSPMTGAVIGYTLPGGPHTALLDGPAVWTWGERQPVCCALDGAAIEEAWAITWP